MATLGFIGTGNMGGALARAAAKTKSNNILLANRHPEKAMALAREIGADVCDNVSVAEGADFIFLGVKPQMLGEMLGEIAGALKSRKTGYTLVSMAAGVSIDRIYDMLDFEPSVIRIMPNTPAAIGEGMILYASKNVTDEQVDVFLQAMKGAGRFSALDEKLIDAGSSVSGCGPAFAAMFIEALADGAVACGLPRARALEYAAQMTAGTAKLMLETGAHPGAMKDAVCSPGGTTIQGVRTLEEAGFRGAVMDAVIASYEKTLEL